MAYDFRIWRRCASPKTMMWSAHSRRIDPISRSAKPFCQGEAGAIGLSRMPIARSRRGRGKVPLQPIVRVSILRCTPDRFAEMRQMMIDAEKVLRPGIESMRGLLAYYGDTDEIT